MTRVRRYLEMAGVRGDSAFAWMGCFTLVHKMATLEPTFLVHGIQRIHFTLRLWITSLNNSDCDNTLDNDARNLVRFGVSLWTLAWLADRLFCCRLSAAIPNAASIMPLCTVDSFIDFVVLAYVVPSPHLFLA